jgi:phosphate binding protein
MTKHASSSTRKRVAKLALVSLIAPLGVTMFASSASAAKLNDSCSKRDLYKVQQVGTTYIRCMPLPGTSAHTKGAKFSYQRIDKRQFDFSNVKKKTSIRVDGSSTVAPLMTVAAKYFETTTGKKARVSIGISGTGGGFEKFCKGETDMSNASRQISSSEAANCARNGITYTEIIVANDGLAVVVNPKNPINCIKMDELKTMWKPNTANGRGSGPGVAKTWGDAIPGNTLGNLDLYGAGSDSGTFDSFNTFVHGSSSTSRTDFQATENDTVTVNGVRRSTNALGYYGLSYALENSAVNKAVSLDAGKGCVKPTIRTVQNRTYPMARDLFVYVKNSAAASNPAIKQFMNFYYANATAISRDALFVPLTPRQVIVGQRALRRIQ